MSSDESKIKGTVEEYKDNNKSSYMDFVSKRDAALVLGLVFILNFLGIVNIPYLERLDQFAYGDIINVIIISFLITFATVWQRFKKIVDKIHSKDWFYIDCVDASGEVIGHFKTDKETISNNDLREFKDGADRIKNFRDGIDIPSRRYGLVKDIEQKDNKVILENIQGWEEVAKDDQIIANKTSLKSWVDNVLPEAQEGRKRRLAQNSIREKIISEVVKQIAVKFEHSTSKNVIDLDQLYSETIDGYEKVNKNVNDYIEETEIVKKEDIVKNNSDTDNLEENNLGTDEQS